MLSRILLATLLIIPFSATADPVIGGQLIPPASSFTHIEDPELLDKIGLDFSAWCYDDEANALLITAGARERARCELTLKYELQRERTKSEFEINRLNVRIETLKSQHTELMLIKDEEIEKLTQSAIKRPNDYSAWWASGGFLAGTAVTVVVFLLVQ